MASITYSETGVATLLPYCMPRSMDEYGDEGEQERFCIAYSRDGWFVLDTEQDLVCFWAPTEERALERRASLLKGGETDV